MNIGVINKKQIIVNEKPHQYLEMIIRPPFMESATFTVSVNKKKEDSEKKEPDFKIYYSYNRKGESYRRIEVGAIWNKITNDGLKYKSGNIQSPIFPNGTLYFSIFEAKPFEGEKPESITWSHEVVWTPYRPNEEQSSNNSNSNYNQNTNYDEIDESEIPF